MSRTAILAIAWASIHGTQPLSGQTALWVEAGLGAVRLEDGA